MIRGLIRKELRQLLPLIVALGVLFLWGVVDTLILHPADIGGFAQDSWLFGKKADGQALIELFLGVLIAYSLFPGEHAQRTIDFLYTLPLRRQTLFLVKYLVGVGIHAAMDLLGTLELLLQHALNPNSFEQQALQPRFVLILIAADLFLPLVSVAYGMLLSYFRRLGWLLFAAIWMALELVERFWPAAKLLNLKTVTAVEHDGLTPLINWNAWAVHAVLAGVALRVAAHLWLGRQERFAQFYEKLSNSVALRRVAGTVLVLILTLGIVGGLATAFKPDAAESSNPSSELSVQALRTFDTQHFRFTYRSAQEAQAKLVLREADQAYQRVQTWLGSPPLDRITADLTDVSDEHLGIAGWTTMRLSLSRPMDETLLRRVLYHETTHVLAAALTAGLAKDRAIQLRFFNEGLAEFVANELLDPKSAQREQGWQVAALAHREFRLRFEDLLDPTAFLRRHDEYLLYPLGELWTAALVETCGRTSPAQVLRLFVSPETPRSLQGFDLWRYALQAQRCDLDRVLGAYEQRLRRLAQKATDVPVASATLIGREGDELIFEVSVRAPAPGPWTVSVRVRIDAVADPANAERETTTVSVGKPERLRVPTPEGDSQRLEFQVGARYGEWVTFFSRWQSTTRPPE